MHPTRDITIFAASVFGYSLVFSYLARNASGNPLFAIAIASVMLSALGVPWPRKLVFATVCLGGFVLFELAFDALGLTARMASFGYEMVASVIGTVYIVLVLAYPLVVLLLFVGRDPSVLWVGETPGRSGPKKKPPHTSR